MPSRNLVFLLAAAAIGGFAADPPPGPSPSDTARQIGLSPLTVGNAPATLAPRERQEEAREASGPRSIIRSDVDVVLVPVTVTDPMNRFVTGLDQDAFEVYEDKVKQKIVSFGSEDSPLSVGIVFDTSASMGNKLERSRLSVAEFFKTANPEDEAFLVEFNDRPQLVVPLTHNLEDIQNRLTFTQSKGRTALLDGIYLALQTMKKARNPRKALIVISDGGDTAAAIPRPRCAIWCAKRTYRYMG